MSDEAKRALTAEDLKQISVYSDPHFTPDGGAYTFVSTTANDDNDYASQLFVHSLNEQEPRQWTFENAKNNHPRFSPDGKLVVFQSTRSGVPQLWLLHTDGGEAKQLTTFKHGAVNPEWSKEGKYIIFSAPLEKDDDVTNQHELSENERQKEKEEKNKQPFIVNRLKYKSDAKGFHDDKRTQIIRFNVAAETFEQLTSADTDHHFEDISPDGKQLLFSANLSTNEDYELKNDLYLLNLPTKETITLTDGNGQYGNARFSPSGAKIACFGHEFAYQGATLNDLFVFDAATGDRRRLSSDWDFQLGDAMIGDTRMGLSEIGPVWSHDENHLFFVGTDFGATGLYQSDLNGELTVLYNNNNHVFGFSYNGETFILGISTPTNPCNFHRLDNKGQINQLTDANRNFLDDVKLSEPETLTFHTDDDWAIQGWLLRPYGFEEGKKYPFVLEVHGGPHAMYGQTFFHEMQLLAAKGYVVLYTNPRGSHGYGQTFVNACREDYGGKDYSDLMRAVDGILDEYNFIDKDRLGITGGSYGGFMTNWIVSHTNRFKAAVTQRCISNWLSFYGVSDIGYFFTKWELGKNLLEDPAKLWDFSPLKYVENIETPLLIVHGEKDYRCPIEQGEQMFVALKHMRKEVEFVRFPDANHELSRSGKPEMRIERLNHITRWFDEYL
ncbi:acylaminoacyl-peptidase [Lentibacillus halodurans]|uniref:Acylaminoacyl-peptidase n=1 Tax=Lentibacillus halodurans TaxID=237679 RepID=A0A1I0Z9K6_9BACI|nr:S9 family peptidase [Lentibacillus halodurans]SFB21260.1 acylaminoacyl-peptidase [Lentibacillus halodurans]